MRKKKHKGKNKMSKIFQKLEEGDRVAVNIEPSEDRGFQERIQGRTGRILVKRGKAYIVKIKDNNKDKYYIIKPVHLKKLR